MSGSRRTYRTLPLDVPHSPAERIALSRWTYRTLPQNVPHSPAGRTALSRRTYRTLPLDVPHSPAERIALSRRTSRTLPREVPHSVLHSPAERPSKIDAYFVACARSASPAPLPPPSSRAVIAAPSPNVFIGTRHPSPNSNMYTEPQTNPSSRSRETAADRNVSNHSKTSSRKDISFPGGHAHHGKGTDFNGGRIFSEHRPAVKAPRRSQNPRNLPRNPASCSVNFHEILQDNLGNVKEVLETVRDGTVNDILTQLGLEEYGSYFEEKGIRDVWQLMKDSSQVEQVEQLNSGERERIQHKIKGIRDSFEGIKEAIKEVHEMGERRYEACKGITEKFTTFLEDITKSRKAISTLLADKPNKEETLTMNYIIAGSIAAACLIAFLGGALYCGFAWYAGKEIATSVKALTSLSGLVGGASGGLTWHIGQQPPELEEIDEALKEMQINQLDAINTEASKQKMAWQEIEKLAGKIVHYMEDSKMVEKAGGLQLHHDLQMKRMLRCIEVVSEDAEELEANVNLFEKEAKMVWENVRALSLMKDYDTALAKPAEDSPRPLQAVLDLVQKTVKRFKPCDGAEQMSTPMKMVKAD
ncbi:hypothetical protein Bbelb_156180 [Branchiostoma belcheri]|nr:hypothetical protein Bbelb_156180 [Branchiostoma belcheri]